MASTTRVSVDAFDRIHQAIDDYCTYERESLLDDILSDFRDACKDAKVILALEEIIGYYRGHSPASTPGTPGVHRVRGPRTPPTGDNSPIIAPSLPPDAPVGPSAPSAPSETCVSLIKSGVRKGHACGGKVHAGGLCKRHQPKVALSEEKCPALMKAGARKGQVCGSKVANGDTYCGKHKITKCVFKLASGDCCGKNISHCSPTETHCRIHVKNELSLDTKKFVTALNRFGNMEHKYSGLVFENKKVIGAQHPTGTIVTNLNDDDLECVIVYGLPIDTCFSTQMTDYLNRRRQKESTHATTATPATTDESTQQ
jgi:hypothetical protein